MTSIKDLEQDLRYAEEGLQHMHDSYDAGDYGDYPDGEARYRRDVKTQTEAIDRLERRIKAQR